MVAKLARVIRLFGDKKPEFTIDDSVAEFEKRPTIELYVPVVQYDALFEQYDLSATDFREKIANLTNPNSLEEDGDTNLRIN